MSEHKTEDCVGLNLYSTSMFALLPSLWSLPSFITIPSINYGEESLIFVINKVVRMFLWNTLNGEVISLLLDQH